MSTRRQSIRVFNTADENVIMAFLDKYPQINMNRFFRDAVMKEIQNYDPRDLQNIIDRLNDHQERFGGKRIGE